MSFSGPPLAIKPSLYIFNYQQYTYWVICIGQRKMTTLDPMDILFSLSSIFPQIIRALVFVGKPLKSVTVYSISPNTTIFMYNDYKRLTDYHVIYMNMSYLGQHSSYLKLKQYVSLCYGIDLNKSALTVKGCAKEYKH